MPLTGSLLQFLEEQCIVATTTFIACQLFIDLYLTWCKENNIEPMKILVRNIEKYIENSPFIKEYGNRYIYLSGLKYKNSGRLSKEQQRKNGEGVPEIKDKTLRVTDEQRQHFEKIIKEKEGIILEGIYNKYKSRLKIKCHKGHIFNTIAAYILTDRWCEQCNTEENNMNTITIDIVREKVMSRGGKLLSTEYINSRSSLLVKCNKLEHPPFETAWQYLQRNKWCPKCATEKVAMERRLDISVPQKLA